MKRTRWGLRVAILAAATSGLCWASFALYAARQPVLGIGTLGFGLLLIALYGNPRTLAWKYLFPGVAGMLVFALFPLLYTVAIGFTNYSSIHLLSEERARAYLLDRTEVDEEHAMAFTLHRDGDAWQIALSPPEGKAGERFVSAPLALDAAASGAPVAMRPGTPASEAVALREVLLHRDALLGLALAPPAGPVLNYAGLREFASLRPLWQAQADGGLRNTETGAVFRASERTGFFETADGERIAPGFTTGVGFEHYARMLFDADFRGPFVAIFVWTVAFAGLTVVLGAGLGTTLAVLLNWEALRFRTAYRTLLFLPYAVPAFISILVFRGLFNENFGEINAILSAVFGVRPAWFADPWLAKAMILVVNVWLGFPYFMVLATGLIKSIPADLYEASAIAGAGPLANFFRITAPLIARPLTPLLVSAFAFNFNNFVLISLLTDGRPDFLNTKLPAGTTDILVSYTYRIAFTDSGQNFGLAAAISTLIFLMVAGLSLVQLRLSAGSGGAR